MSDDILGRFTKDIDIVISDKLMHFHVCTIHGSDRKRTV